jgi:hypothetical protein
MGDVTMWSRGTEENEQEAKKEKKIGRAKKKREQRTFGIWSVSEFKIDNTYVRALHTQDA